MLPSILDLLSNGCGGRPKSDRLTLADIAYLKALYRLDLDTNLSVEMNDLADNLAQDLRASPSN